MEQEASLRHVPKLHVSEYKSFALKGFVDRFKSGEATVLYTNTLMVSQKKLQTFVFFDLARVDKENVRYKYTQYVCRI